MLQLIILGLLYDKDLHPYEVMQIMKSRYMENYIKINYGTLYYNVEQLHKRGDIAVKEVVHDEKRPDKTIYTITPKGRERFRELLHRQFMDRTVFHHPLYPALMFAHYAERNLVITALEKRKVRLEENILQLQQIMEEFGHKVPWGTFQIMKNGMMHKETELTWINEFLKELNEK
jgi:DNA-binding PadR family transcriptional regulator